MKILIASDLHGSLDNLKRLKKQSLKENVDKHIFLGDIYYGGYSNYDEFDKLIKSFEYLYVIEGNCDSDLDVECSGLGFIEHYSFTFNDKEVYCTHGNKFNINNYPQEKFDIMFYGHTHKKMIIKDNDKIFANPGSIGRPRDDCSSYIIMDDNYIYIKDLDGNILNMEKWN